MVLVGETKSNERFRVFPILTDSNIGRVCTLPSMAEKAFFGSVSLLRTNGGQAKHFSYFHFSCSRAINRVLLTQT